jgi:hypothetical protein
MAIPGLENGTAWICLGPGDAVRGFPDIVKKHPGVLPAADHPNPCPASIIEDKGRGAFPYIESGGGIYLDPARAGHSPCAGEFPGGEEHGYADKNKKQYSSGYPPPRIPQCLHISRTSLE